MFKKGHIPHNKGDEYVHANYRNKPRMNHEMREHMMEPINPYKIDIEIRDLLRTKNNIYKDRVESL